MPELVHKARRTVCCESCEKSCDVQLLLEWERGRAAETTGPALVTQPEAGLILRVPAPMGTPVNKAGFILVWKVA